MAATPGDTLGSKSQAEALFHRLDTASDPAAAYRALPASEKATFDAYMLPATETTSVKLTPADSTATAAILTGKVQTAFTSDDEARAAVAAASGCYTAQNKVTKISGVGVALWDVWVEGRYCSNGSSVTSVSFSRTWSTIAGYGWRDGGQLASGAVITGGTAKIWGQRNMVLGTGGWDVQSVNQCARAIGTAAATIRGDASCSNI